MFISKKKYNEMIEQREEWQEIQKLNLQLIERCKKMYRDYCGATEKILELTEQVATLTRQRDHYFKLLKEQSKAYEEGKYLTREAE